jgi:hypothetical protein
MPFSLSSSSASAAGHSPTIQLSPIQALLVIIMCSATTLLVSQTLSYAESSSTAATAAHALLPPAPYPELDPSSSSRAASSSSSSSWASSNARDALSGPGTGQRRAITAAVSGGGTSSSGGRARASNKRLPTSSSASAEGRDRGYPKRSDPGNSLRRFHDDIKMRGRTYLDGMEAQQADALGEDLASRSWPDPDITRMDPTLLVTRNGVTNPSVAWLMSFPNRSVICDSMRRRLLAVLAFACLSEPLPSHLPVSSARLSPAQSQRDVVHHSHDKGRVQLHHGNQLRS